MRGMLRVPARRWQQLHRLLYFAALLAVLHFLWLVKADIRKPLIYGAILAVLLLYRLVVWMGPAIKKRGGILPAPRPEPAAE
jgi:sulfoxide reductase heme-binding subunit YedZ